MSPKLHFQVYSLELLISKSLGNGNPLQYKVSDKLKTYLQHTGGRSAEREKQWNFARGVPRRCEPAVRQPSASASERQPDATRVLPKHFRVIAASSWFI